MRERIEQDIERILAPYFDALDNAVVHASFEGEVIASDHPDVGARIAAAEKLLDRVYGKPRQALEHTGEDGGPIETGPRFDLRGLSDEELDVLRRLNARRAE